MENKKEIFPASPEFYRKQFYTNKILLVDGLGRTGKSLFGPVLSSFKNVELERIEPILEMLPILDSFGKIDHASALAVLRQEIDMKLYDTAIGRNTNFRPKDHSSAFKSSKKWTYLQRLFKKDGDEVVERLKNEQLIFQNQTHDLLGRCQLYFDAFGERLRILEVVRHPLDVAYSFLKGDWGKRFGTDARVYALSIKHKNEALPWYAAGWEEQYLKMSPLDRIIEFLWVINKWNGESYAQLNSQQKKQILFIPFEKFVVEPEKYLSPLEQFLGTVITSKTKKALKKQRCPRVLDPEERIKKREEMQKLASPSAYEKLLTLSQDYEKRYL